jgi:hypothetical protein
MIWSLPRGHFELRIIVYLSNFHTVHYVPIVPNVAREKNDPTSLCVKHQNKHRVRADRLRGSPTLHLLSHLAKATMVGPRGKAPEHQAVASLAPLTGVASPLAGIIFHVPEPCASC